MFTYFKMKRYEWKVKFELYGLLLQFIQSQQDNIAKFFSSQEELMETSMKLVNSLKDVSPKDMQSQFVSNLVQLIHNEDVTDSEE